jgi:serine acetyltransferase
VGANAVVLADVAEDTTVVGVPARPTRSSTAAAPGHDGNGAG